MLLKRLITGVIALYWVVISMLVLFILFAVAHDIYNKQFTPKRIISQQVYISGNY